MSTPDPDGQPRPPRRRRHRRVVAPPTNPQADPSDDISTGSDSPAPPASARTGTGVATDDAYDAWIRAQRPPHWD